MLRCHGCGRRDGALQVCKRCQRAVFCGSQCALGAKCIEGRVVGLEPGAGKPPSVAVRFDPVEQMNEFLTDIMFNVDGAAAREFFVSLTLTYGVTDYRMKQVGADVRQELDKETGVAFPSSDSDDDADARLRQLRALVARGQQAEQPPNYEAMVDLLQAFDSIRRVRNTITDRYRDMDLYAFYEAELLNDFDLRPPERGAAIMSPPDPVERRLQWLREMRQAYDELMSMIGLDEAKREVIRMIQSHMVRPFDTLSNHRGIIAWGNPGTGKTEFSRRMARLFYYFGLSVERSASVKEKSDFTGQYLGGTASKTKRLIYNNFGSVLFFDEAYGLTSDQYGLIALDTIVSLLSTYEGLVVMVLAGYVEDIQQRILDLNPGLSSRFPNRILFENFTAAELWDITLQRLEKRNTALANENVAETIKTAWAVLVKADKLANENARAIANFVDNAINIQRGLLPFVLGKESRIQPLQLTEPAVEMALQRMVGRLAPGMALRIVPSGSSAGPNVQGFTQRLPETRTYTRENRPDYLHIPRRPDNNGGGGEARPRENEEDDDDEDFVLEDVAMARQAAQPRRNPTRRARLQ